MRRILYVFICIEMCKCKMEHISCMQVVPACSSETDEIRPAFLIYQRQGEGEMEWGVHDANCLFLINNDSLLEKQGVHYSCLNWVPWEGSQWGRFASHDSITGFGCMRKHSVKKGDVLYHSLPLF